MPRLALLQFRPELALSPHVAEKNRYRAELLLANQLKNLVGVVDVIVLPELAFHGYNFSGRDEIEPVAEACEGPTYEWCRRVALTYGAYVAAGYPEKEGDHLYNSVCFVGRDGKLLHTYRKHFLYDTDMTWATEGPGFQVIDVPTLGRVGFGICMDVNPREFRSSFTAFEFARFHLVARTDLILFSAAWLHRKQPKVLAEGEADVRVVDLDEDSGSSSGSDGEGPSVPDVDEAAESESATEDREALQQFVSAAVAAAAARAPHARWRPGCHTAPASPAAPARTRPSRTQLYWLTRLAPLIGRPVVFAAANRVGTERNVRFAGDSCVLDMRGACVTASLGPDEEGVLLASVPAPARAPLSQAAAASSALQLGPLPSLQQLLAGQSPSGLGLGLAGAALLASRYGPALPSLPCVLPGLFC